MDNYGLLSRPRASLAVLLLLCAVSAFLIDSSVTGIPRSAVTDENFTVVQRYYGVDAAEMEHIAAIPLEDALAGIRGLKKIHSVSENGSARVFAYFEGRSAGRYEAVREAAQEIYKSLPSSAQRPEILSSGDSRIPVWVAAVSLKENRAAAPSGVSPGRLLERSVKPVLESLPGSGEVEISGAACGEIIIAVDGQKAALLGLDAAAIASVLSRNDAVFSGGNFFEGKREIPVVFDGRYDSVRSLENSIIPVKKENGPGFVLLKNVASVREEQKEAQSRSRLNGKETAVIAVTAGGCADLGKLSAMIQNEMMKFPELEFTVLSDRGEEERAAYKSVLSAAVQGSAAVAIMAALLCSGGRPRKGRRFLVPVCALSVPAIMLFSAALLGFFGRALDKLVLAGLSSGAGAAVDAVILCAEYMGAVAPSEGRKALESLRFPLISGSATTIIALLPLIFQKSAAGFNSVALAVGAVNVISMILALTLLPPLFLYNGGTASPLSSPSPRHPPLSRKAPPFRYFRLFAGMAVRRFPVKPTRLLAALVRFCVRKPFAVMAFWLFLTAAGIVSLVSGGADTGARISETSVYAQIEFEGGLHRDAVDRVLAGFGQSLKTRPGIIHVQTSAHTGSGSALLRFDPALIDAETVRTLLRSTPVPGGFVYIGESSPGERIWELYITGDDGKLCREFARKAAGMCMTVPLVDETVLNFKEGGSRLTLKAGRELLAEAGLSFSGLGTMLRYGVHGPVIYKRLSSEGETDVRLMWNRSGKAPGMDEIRQSVFSGPSSPVSAGSLLTETEDREPDLIQRKDRRRSASFSIRTKGMDPRKIRDLIMPVLSHLDLPPGYGIEFDPAAIQSAEALSGSWVLFALALCLCYMILAASRESFLFPFVVLAVVPPSLAFPALCMASQPLDAAASSAFVAVSGLAINAAVLVAENAADKADVSGLYRILRKRFPILAATSGTTIAGALPFLFLARQSASVVRALSLVSAFGVAASVVCSITLIPALASRFPGLFRRFQDSRKPRTPRI
ncbi:MAG: efflux RND transporter permease subunit [Treponema sp.]|jgi:multidrug efflux pump subunit AcrB|nr:efflux RND transporter permease subunit [Treponema sp.]